MVYQYDYFKILQGAFHKEKKPGRANIISFNHFLFKSFENIIIQKNPLILRPSKESEEHNIFIDKVTFASPPERFIKNKKINLYPNMARINADNYTIDAFVSGKHIIYKNTGGTKIWEGKFENVKFCEVPIVVGCDACYTKNKDPQYLLSIGECPYDFGGYFIVNGNEKAIIPQEQKCNNMFFLNKGKDEGEFICFIQSKPHRVYGFPYKTHVKYKKNGEIVIAFAIAGAVNEKEIIPISVIFRALGIVNDKQMCEMILGGNKDPYLISLLKKAILTSIENEPSLIDVLNNSISSAEYCIKKFTKNPVLDKTLKTTELKETGTFSDWSKNTETSKQLKIATEEFLNKRLFPHVGKDLIKKQLILAHMIMLVLKCKAGMIPVDNQQNYGNKRLLGTGSQMSVLLRNLYSNATKKFQADANRGLQGASAMDGNKQNELIISILQSSGAMITEKFSKDINQGKWPVTGTGKEHEGVTSTVERKSINDTIANLNKVTTAINPDKKLKNSDMNVYNTTQTFVNSVNATPDGEKVGINKEISMSLEITIESDTYNLYEIIKNINEDKESETDFIPFDKIDYNEYDKYYKIFINADIVGITTIPNKFRNYLVEKRRKGLIDKYIEITADYLRREIRIYTDEGRCCCPFLIVNDGKLAIDELSKEELMNMTWSDLCTRNNKKGPYIEYLDIHEMEYNSIIAKDCTLVGDKLIRYKHCMIHPTFHISYNEAFIVFPNHNQSPRIVYEFQQIKQAIGFPLSNYKRCRMDQTLNVLETTEKQLVNTDDVVKMGLHKIPGGLNVTVAIMCFTGYNMEDAIIFNQDSIDRGLFALNKYMTYTAKLGSKEEFKKPDQSETERYKYDHSYEKLDSYGKPKLGAKLNDGDIIIGKTVENTNTKKKEKKYIDDSIIFHGDDGTYIDKIPDFSKDKSSDILKVRTLSYRKPKIGDKFCYDKHTKILVMRNNKKQKFIKFKNLSYDDYVFGLSGWEKINEIYEFHLLNEIMINIENDNVSLCVTPEHNLYISYDEKNYKFEKAINAYNIAPFFMKNNTGGCILVNKNDIKNSVYSDKVYCCECQSHVMVIQRNNKICYCGNSSRHSQKGTVSITFRSDQLPFTENGMVPDIIINPHCIPSRMTIGQLMESLIGKYAALKCSFVDGSGFMNYDVDNITKYLESSGFNGMGEEYMYDPLTGKKMNARIFIGPVYYQRLKQMIDDKFFVRQNGPIDALTHQPSSGKSSGGGLRTGEMELSSITAHGLSSCLHEMIYDKSDGIETYICKKCGKICVFNEDTNKFFCKYCKNLIDFAKVKLGYASKLLIYELYSMGIAIRLKTE